MSIVISILIALLILAVVLWAIDYIAPPEIKHIARIVAVVLFLIYLVRLVWPMLTGGTV